MMFDIKRSLRNWLGETQIKQIPIALTRESIGSPFDSMFADYTPLQHNLKLYSVIREAIPLCDIAVIKLNELIGEFRFDALGNTRLQEYMDDWLNRVKVNYFGNGFFSWMKQINDSTLSKGMGFGEAVLTQTNNDIYNLKIAKADYMRFMKKDGQIVIGQVNPNGLVEALPSMETIYYIAFDQRDGHPQGYSIFSSLPFVSQIFIRILKSIDNTIWRVGDPSYLIIAIGDKEGKLEDVDLNKLSKDLRGQLVTVNKDRKLGQVRDVFAGIPYGGTIEVKILGGQEAIAPLEIPTHTVLEQITARLHLPPSLLGLYKWSSRESMASHQVDMLMSIINGYREHWDPDIERVLDLKLILNGYAGAKFKWEWDPINLKDEKEQAQSAHLLARAREADMNVLEKLIMMGLITEDQEVEQYLVDHGLKSNLSEKHQVRIDVMNDRLKFMRAGNAVKSYMDLSSVIPTNGNEYKLETTFVHDN